MGTVANLWLENSRAGGYGKREWAYPCEKQRLVLACRIEISGDSKGTVKDPKAMSQLSTNPVVVTIGVGISLCLLYCVARCVVGCFQDFLITCCCWDPTNRSRGQNSKTQCLDERDVIDIINENLKKMGHTRVPNTEPPPLTELKDRPPPLDGDDDQKAASLVITDASV